MGHVQREKLLVNLVLTMFIFKYSDIIFFSEIGIAALNFICIIFSIILRVWRSNGSVLDLHYSSSNAISIIILVIIILNLICSLGEDVLYYFIVPSFVIEDYEVWYNKENQTLMNRVAKTRGEVAEGVPYIVIGDKSWHGFAQDYTSGMLEEIKKVAEE